jgi:hypothetical protein
MAPVWQGGEILALPVGDLCSARSEKSWQGLCVVVTKRGILTLSACQKYRNHNMTVVYQDNGHIAKVPEYHVKNVLKLNLSFMPSWIRAWPPVCRGQRNPDMDPVCQGQLMPECLTWPLCARAREILTWPLCARAREILTWPLCVQGFRVPNLTLCQGQRIPEMVPVYPGYRVPDLTLCQGQRIPEMAPVYPGLQSIWFDPVSGPENPWNGSYVSRASEYLIWPCVSGPENPWNGPGFQVWKTGKFLPHWSLTAGF